MPRMTQHEVSDLVDELLDEMIEHTENWQTKGPGGGPNPLAGCNQDNQPRKCIRVILDSFMEATSRVADGQPERDAFLELRGCLRAVLPKRGRTIYFDGFEAMLERTWRRAMGTPDYTPPSRRTGWEVVMSDEDYPECVEPLPPPAPCEAPSHHMYPYTSLRCRACNAYLNLSCGLADGCACNSPRGVNHGIVPTNVCTCVECDPEQTGSVRLPPVTRGGGRMVIVG